MRTVELHCHVRRGAAVVTGSPTQRGERAGQVASIKSLSGGHAGLKNFANIVQNRSRFNTKKINITVATRSHFRFTMRCSKHSRAL